VARALRPVAISTGLLVVYVTALTPSPVQGEKPGAVVVVNDRSQPVPVVGAVTLAPGGTVNVGNTSDDPVLVRSVDGAAAPQPFRLAGDDVCSSGPVKGILESNNTGKLMVVENVSFMVQIRKGFAVTQAAMYINSGMPTVVFDVLQIPEIIGSFSRFGGSAAVKAYIEPGGQAALSIAETSNGDCNLHFEVSGVLVNP
jgi:hypothetical protein